MCDDFSCACAKITSDATFSCVLQNHHKGKVLSITFKHTAFSHCNVHSVSLNYPLER